jgi:hypothetical protein
MFCCLILVFLAPISQELFFYRSFFKTVSRMHYITEYSPVAGLQMFIFLIKNIGNIGFTKI